MWFLPLASPGISEAVGNSLRNYLKSHADILFLGLYVLVSDTVSKFTD